MRIANRKDMVVTPDLEKYHTGVIHMHSRYSHDGEDSIPQISLRLKRDKIDFCVLTDHFEDFDAPTFEKYLAEINEVNLPGDPVFVPGVEAEFRGFHVVFFPVTSYDAVHSLVVLNTLPGGNPLALLAHPTKHAVPEVSDFLRENRVHGFEIWNQQADGNYLPPAAFFQKLIAVLPADMPAVLFGNDIHSMKHRLNNLLLIPRNGALTSEFIVERLRRKEFMNFNRLSAKYLPGNCSTHAMKHWLIESEREIGLKTRFLLLVKKFLKFYYDLLPKRAKLFVNGLKNTVKNKL